jgi:hypothetical protein
MAMQKRPNPRVCGAFRLDNPEENQMELNLGKEVTNAI